MNAVRALFGAVLAVAAIAVGAPAALADTGQPADNACDQLSPSGAPCIGADKLAERLAAECRRVGRPASQCQMPLGHRVGDDISANYLKSWLHQAAAFQYSLGDRLPLTQAQWLGTHNSFNTVAEPATLSHTDSNQQLTLTQQLDIDMRSLELDLHYLPSPNAGGSKAVVVCHGRGPDQAHFGCTNERLFTQVLPEIATWLKAHPRQVILLYLEDELGDPAGYTQSVATLDKVLTRADGSSLIYRPIPSDVTSKGCADLPLGISRDDVRKRHAQVVIVGNCRSGWSSDVYGWDDVHVESGSTPNYKPFPTCDATYPRAVYATKLVRYYEDSTFVSAVIDPTQNPEAAEAGMLSPEKTGWMTRCGVNLFGFDQILPDDGRIAASIWSWDKDKPNPSDGPCTVQGPSGRWTTHPCNLRRQAACRIAGRLKITHAAYTYAGAREACRQRGGALGLPRTGYENSVLRAAARPGSELWLGYRLSG